MTSGRAQPATPEQIAMYGHIAAMIRAKLKDKGWSIGDLNQAMGYERANTGIYTHVNGKGAPGPKVRERLAKVLGVHEDELRARPVPSAAMSERRALAVVDAGRPIVRQQGDVLSFTVNHLGMARIKVDATLPLDKATPLFRMLLDAGLVFGEAIDE